jgi:hypothetical protein
MDYLLLHGYGVGAKYANFHDAEGLNGGFGAFDKLILEDKAKVFRWDIPRSFTFWEFINPFKSLDLYHKEIDKSQNIDTHKPLQKELFDLLPHTIVCHSMGTLLLINYLEHFDLPSSVTKIVFIQGSIANSTRLPVNLQHLVESKKITLLNLFCPWDQALLTVLLLNRTVTIGLTGYKNPLVKNIFFPLYKRLNLHTSSINDPNLINRIEKRNAPNLNK